MRPHAPSRLGSVWPCLIVRGGNACPGPLHWRGAPLGRLAWNALLRGPRFGCPAWNAPLWVPRLECPASNAPLGTPWNSAWNASLWSSAWMLRLDAPLGMLRLERSSYLEGPASVAPLGTPLFRCPAWNVLLEMPRLVCLSWNSAWNASLWSSTWTLRLDAPLGTPRLEHPTWTAPLRPPRLDRPAWNASLWAGRLGRRLENRADSFLHLDVRLHCSISKFPDRELNNWSLWKDRWLMQDIDMNRISTWQILRVRAREPRWDARPVPRCLGGIRTAKRGRRASKAASLKTNHRRFSLKWSRKMQLLPNSLTGICFRDCFHPPTKKSFSVAKTFIWG